MATERSSSNCQTAAPARSAEHTARLAWLILSLAMVCFLLLCLLAGYGLWQFRGTIRGPQGNNTLEAYNAPVFRIYAGETQLIAVPEGRPVPLREGETVQIGERAPAGASALITFWDGSTAQLYAGTRLVMERLQATLYSDQVKDIALEMSSGQVLLGVAQAGRYQDSRFAIHTPQAELEFEAGGTYLLRVGQQTEIAVRRGQVRLTFTPASEPVIVSAGQKAVVVAGKQPKVEAARWQLLHNGDFALGLDGWTFRSEQTEDGGTVDAVYRLEQQMVDGQMAWVVGLERRGGLVDRCLAVLSQPLAADVSPYNSVRLEMDLKINYQSLPGGGVLGIDYPLNVRIHYRDVEGESREYVYGFYDHTNGGYKVKFPAGGETRQVAHYRWEHISLEILDLRPRPVLLTGVDLFASGNDYLSWVANVSLTAEY